MKVGNSYEIEWNDTFSFNGWWDDDELKEKSKEMSYFQRSVGIYAGEYFGWVVLVIHENPNNKFSRWGHPDFIPKKSIKKIKRL